jgi:lipoate-protein ligase A
VSVAIGTGLSPTPLWPTRGTLPGLPEELELLLGRAGGEPALDVALSVVLLEAVAAGAHPAVLRCYRPPATAAFGRRDTFLAGFGAAAEAARRHGFTPVIRAPGGRAAAYHEGCLVIEEIRPAADAMAGMHERFESDAAHHAGVLRELGVDARVGEVRGEYCPGAFSVNARGQRKLAGGAQRIIRGGWLLSTVIAVEGAARIRGVLEDMYCALGLEWDPETVGAIADEVGSVSVADVEHAMLAAYRARYELLPATVPPGLEAAARARVSAHSPR